MIEALDTGNPNIPVIPNTLLGYCEWIRVLGNIKTPLMAGMEGAKAGDVPPWQPDPGNYQLGVHISNAAKTVNRHVRLADAGSIRSIPIDVQTATGPFQIDLAGVSGFPDRNINSIRRAWWFDGATVTRLDPVILDNLDLRWDPYEQDAPSTPRRFAIEGYTLYLDPAPASAGQFRFMGSCGVLAPKDNNDGFDQIPTDYDPCVLYIALVEWAKSVPSNREMAALAQVFTPDAADGLQRLGAWFNGGSNEQVQPTVMFDARPMRRFRRWR